MAKQGFFIFLLLLIGFTSARISTNQWLVRVQTDGQEGRDALKSRAKRIAQEKGFRTLLDDYDDFFGRNEFLFIQPDAKGSSREIHDALVGHPEIESADNLKGYPREKRGYKLREIEEEKEQLEPDYSEDNSLIGELTSDPLFGYEWYIHNTGQAEGTPGLDLNVLEAWAQNVTGKGVITAIMDDGIDYLHPDIAPNYAPEASYDFSSDDAHPYPRYTDTWFNSHGTRCAGQVAAAGGNGVCGVGVAPGSRVAGLRMLDQPYMTDLLEAAAISKARHITDIYSASWGPTDNGQIVDGPRNRTMQVHSQYLIY